MQEDNQYIHIEKVISVSGYMGYLEQLDIQASETLFFRGSGDKTWENKPTIYRAEKFISNEDHIYYDMLSRCSDDFKHCDNTFDNLVMMQHYGVPTRLLDITENPLVALYFACAYDEKVNADAKVDILKIDNSAIKRHDSDTVAMLANLVKMPSDFDLKGIQFIQQIDFLSSKLLEKSIDLESFSDEKFSDEIFKEIKQQITVLIDEIGYIDFFKDLVEFLNSSRFFVEQELQRCFDLKGRLPSLSDIECDGNSGLEKELKKYFIKNLLRDIDWLNKCRAHLDKIMSRNSINLDINQLRMFGEDWAQESKQMVELPMRPEDVDRSFSILLFDIVKYFKNHSKYYNHSHAKKAFRKYTAYIQAEKPYFLTELMRLEDIAKVVCVKPKQDNPHIIRQSGAFLLFGLDIEAQDKLSPAQIPEDYYLKNKNGQKVTIHIPKDSKVTIIKQLEALAISAGTLFTDIDKVAADIKNKYSPIKK